jgi:hypothetical protein
LEAQNTWLSKVNLGLSSEERRYNFDIELLCTLMLFYHAKSIIPCLSVLILL